MSKNQIINLVFFIIGVSSAIFIIISAVMRIMKSEIKDLKNTFINEIKQLKLHGIYK